MQDNTGASKEVLPERKPKVVFPKEAGLFFRFNRFTEQWAGVFCDIFIIGLSVGYLIVIAALVRILGGCK